MPADSSQSPELPEEVAPRQLCVNCMFPNEPRANFCEKCGAPLSSYAATGPFEHLFAEGYVYRRAAERPQKFIVVLGIWLIFGLAALVCVGLLAIAITAPGGFGTINVVLGLIAAAGLIVSLVMISRTTWNYLKTKPVNVDADTPESPGQ